MFCTNGSWLTMMRKPKRKYLVFFNSTISPVDVQFLPGKNSDVKSKSVQKVNIFCILCCKIKV